MIIKVRARSNGGQLGWYLVTLGENDHIEILEVDGREDADSDYLRQTIMSMEYNCELTKGDNPFFIGEINPAYGEDKTMTREDWYLAADMIAEANDYRNQRRAIVLHHKKDRVHAHVVWERYSHDTGKLLPIKNSIYKTNDMRPKIEDALGHKRTSHRNPHQPEMKITITGIWNETGSGAEFLKATRNAGFIVAAGTGNRPFMVVNENGRSFNLLRQIDGVRTKDVRARLRGEELITDKRAIEIMRELADSNSGKRERQKIDLKPQMQAKALAFAENRNTVTVSAPEYLQPQKNLIAAKAFLDESRIITNQVNEPANDELQRKQAIATEFADNRQAIKPDDGEREAKRQEVIAEQERIRQKNRQKKLRR